MRRSYLLLLLVAFLSLPSCSKSGKERTDNTAKGKNQNALQEYINTPIDSAKRIKLGSAERDKRLEEQMGSLGED